MKIINIFPVLFILGAVILVGSQFYYLEYDKANNVNGGYLPFVNLTQEERDFRQSIFNFSFTIIIIGMGGMLITIPFRESFHEFLEEVNNEIRINRK
jgi:hypothetical protein